MTPFNFEIWSDATKCSQSYVVSMLNIINIKIMSYLATKLSLQERLKENLSLVSTSYN